MPDDIARRRSRLSTALVGALLPDVPEGQMVRGWLSTWAGIGHMEVGMARDVLPRRPGALPHHGCGVARGSRRRGGRCSGPPSTHSAGSRGHERRPPPLGAIASGRASRGRAPVLEVRAFDDPTIAMQESVKALRQQVSATMRLFPPAYGMGRQAVRQTEVAGHSIPPGMIIIVPTWVVHRDPRWFEEPEVFRPERWAADLIRRLPRHAHFPFGGGPRQCVGNAFAMMEAVVLLTTIAQRLRLELEPGQSVTATPYITLRPEPGIRMRLVRR